MWHLPSLLRIANLVQYQSLLLRKIVQMWYLLHICCNLATLVNPFFRPVSQFMFSLSGFNSLFLFQHMQFLFAHFLHVSKATFIWRKLVLSRMVSLQGLFFMWTQACPEGMCTNGTLVPCQVPSLAPRPGSTSRTFFEQWCGFFYIPQEQISVSAMRRDLRFFVLIRNVNSC